MGEEKEEKAKVRKGVEKRVKMKAVFNTVIKGVKNNPYHSLSAMPIEQVLLFSLAPLASSKQMLKVCKSVSPGLLIPKAGFSAFRMYSPLNY